MLDTPKNSASLLGIPRYNPPEVPIECRDKRLVMTERMIQRAIALTRLRLVLATQPACTSKLDWNDLYVWLFMYLGVPRNELINKGHGKKPINEPPLGGKPRRKPAPKPVETAPFWTRPLVGSDFQSALYREPNYPAVGPLPPRVTKSLDRFHQLTASLIIRVGGYGSAKGYFLLEDFNPLLEEPDLPVFAVMVAIHEALRAVQKKSPKLSELTAEACVFEGVETVTLFGQEFRIQELLARIEEARSRIPSALLDSPPIPKIEEPQNEPPPVRHREAAPESRFVGEGNSPSTSHLQVPGQVGVPGHRNETGGAVRRTWNT